jgi:outer membrane lipoprotein-sorting protein
MKYLILVCLMFLFSLVHGQDVVALIQKVKAKIERVKDYEASGIMKTNVPFLKVPQAEVKIYFKRPGKLKIKNEKGISLIPKGAISMSLNNLMAEKNYTAIHAGSGTINNRPVTIIKLLPLDADADIVLSTLYIDEPGLLILKAVTTTRENGTYELAMEYDEYAAYALPRKAVFNFNTKAYKLPKGVTFDYDDGSPKNKNASDPDNNKGRLEITYNTYIINKGVQDSVFK